MDGTSWDNAYSGAMIHSAMLSMASGDRLYMTEGNYTNDRVITLPAGVSIFGGFTATNPTWATRDSFAHQTVWTQQASTYGWITMSADSTSGQCIDGVTIAPKVACEYKALTFCNITLTGGFLIAPNGEIIYSHAFNCTSTATGKSANSYIFYASTITNCTANNCTSTATGTSTNSGTSANSYIFYAKNTNCTAINCTSTATGTSTYSAKYYSYIFKSIYSNHPNTNCTAINCTSTATGTTPSVGDCICCSLIISSGTNCTAINCTSTATGTGTDTSSYAGDVQTASTIFSNCSYCSVVNCTSSAFSSVVSRALALAQNVIYSIPNTNCLSWNNSGTEYSDYSAATTCAGSTYNAALALTLGTDNSIAKFTDTGYYPAQGVQDTGDCPSPIDDPDGYAAYIASFGDWHPLASSFLVGKGTAQSDVTTDADGVTRPSPPTIGAYEPVPTT